METIYGLCCVHKPAGLEFFGAELAGNRNGNPPKISRPYE